jgi:hypothetical protein|tara:strand:- start:179 stop:568 length:390 start_codon:yes stop_codon:yes gene_type:complete
LLWVSEKALADVERLQVWITEGMRWFLKQVDEERLTFDLSVNEQVEELQELELLKATLKLKAHLMDSGGFTEEHGPVLEMAANALYDVHQWDDESIAQWFAGLVLGEDGQNMGISIDLIDEADLDEGDE